MNKKRGGVQSKKSQLSVVTEMESVMANITSYIMKGREILLLIKHNILMSTTYKKLLEQHPESSVAKPLSATHKTYLLNFTESVAKDLVH